MGEKKKKKKKKGSTAIGRISYIGQYSYDIEIFSNVDYLLLCAQSLFLYLKRKTKRNSIY